jgi:hypothetical protein
MSSAKVPPVHRRMEEEYVQEHISTGGVAIHDTFVRRLMAPFFWRFQAREATGRRSQLPLCARSKAIQADRRRGRVFAAGSNSELAELTFGPRVDASGAA